MTDISPPGDAGTSDRPIDPADDDFPPRHRFGRRGRILSWVLGLAALALLALFAWHLAHPSTSGPSGGGRHRGGGGGGGFGGPGGGMNQPTTVGTVAATAADLPVTVEALGTVTPAATVTIVPQVSGTITELLYREGQLVRKGEVLAVIDPRPYRAALLQAQGALIRDKALLENAQVQLKRYQLLLTQDSIARQDADTQASLVKQYQGTVAVDQGAVQQAEINLGYTRVISPVSGRVGLKVVDIGNYVASGVSTGIAVVTTLQPIDVAFAIPQDQAPAIEKRVAQGAEIPAIALDRTRTTTLDTGRFSTLNNQVDTSTGTIRGKARFANAGFQLYPSQFVNVRLTVDTVAGAITVPPSAVRSGPDGSFVWLFNADRTVSQRNVATGVTTADKVQIIKGLAVGETVVTDGGDRLTAGAKVRLPCDKLPPAMPKKSGGLLSSLFGGGQSANGNGWRRRHAQGGAGGQGAGQPACPNGQQAASAPAVPATPAPAPGAQAASPSAAPGAAGRRHRTAEAPPAASTQPASAPAAPAPTPVTAGACPRPPEGLDPDARHQWFRAQMAGMSDEQRAACRAQREKMRAEGGGHWGGGGQANGGDGASGG
ncbi:MAG TPA: efflux RND transporter periplasmic adaptor subunit [Sphingomonas sp.]